MADKHNFYIDAGSDFELQITVDNETLSDLSEYTPTAKMKRHHLAADNTAITFTCSVNADANLVSLQLSHVQSANLEGGRYVYDVKLTSSANIVVRLVEGMVTVNPKVT